MSITSEQQLVWDKLRDVSVEVPLYTGHNSFVVRINGVEYTLKATTYRDGRSRDDPVWWEDICVYNSEGVLFIGENDFSQLVYDKITDILNYDYDELAHELEGERDIDRYHDYDYNMER